MFQHSFGLYNFNHNLKILLSFHR